MRLGAVARGGRERAGLRPRKAGGLPGTPGEGDVAAALGGGALLRLPAVLRGAMTTRGLRSRPLVPEAVAVGSIVGSVGRGGSFDAGFLPVCSCSAERWKRVYGAFLEGKTLPPVELYKVGGAYFVADGNHRVSVARFRGGGGRGRLRDRVRVTARVVRGHPYTGNVGKVNSAKFTEKGAGCSLIGE